MQNHHNQFIHATYPKASEHPYESQALVMGELIEDLIWEEADEVMDDHYE